MRPLTIIYRLFAWLLSVPRLCLGTIRQRPRQSLILAGICLLILAASSPFIWAGYHWRAGQTALEHYRSAEARQHLDACLKIWPWSRSVRAHLLAARAARRDGDFLAAFEYLQEVQTTLGDQSSETLLEWAMFHAAGGDLEKVESYLQDQARAEPQNIPLILEALTEGYMHVSRVFDALQCVEEWLRRDPDNVQALYLRSSIYRQSGSWTKVVPDLRRVVELDPDRPVARWWLAVALVNVGYFDEAGGHLEYLLKHPPKEIDQTDIEVRLAMCRLRKGEWREARALLDTVLAEHPNHGLALMTRGQIDQMNGQLPEAEKWLRQAAQALPFDHKAHWALTECFRQEGKTKEAQAEQAFTEKLEERWKKYSELTSRKMSQNPGDPANYCEAGKLMLELGNPEACRNWLYSALLHDPHYVPALEGLADYYERQGDGTTAQEYRRQAAVYAPTFTAKNAESTEKKKK